MSCAGDPRQPAGLKTHMDRTYLVLGSLPSHFGSTFAPVSRLLGERSDLGIHILRVKCHHIVRL